MNLKKSAAEQKFFRAMDKKKALSDAEKARAETLKKTAKLRELRLAKEAAERAEQEANPKKKKTPVRKKTIAAKKWRG